MKPMFRTIASLTVIAAACALSPSLNAAEPSQTPASTAQTTNAPVTPMKICVIGATAADEEAAIMAASQIQAHQNAGITLQAFTGKEAANIRKDFANATKNRLTFDHVLTISTTATTAPVPYAEQYTLYRTDMLIKLCDPATGGVLQSWQRKGLSTSRQPNDASTVRAATMEAAMNAFDIFDKTNPPKNTAGKENQPQQPVEKKA